MIVTSRDLTVVIEVVIRHAWWTSLREKCPFRSYSGLYFAAFGLHTERCGVQVLQKELMLSKGPSYIFDKVVNTPLDKTHENEILPGLDMPADWFKEAITRRCFIKMVLLKISQSLQEKFRSETLVFSCEFCKSFKNVSFVGTSENGCFLICFQLVKGNIATRKNYVFMSIAHNT